MADREPAFGSNKLGVSGGVQVPKRVLRALGWEGKEIVLFFFVKDGRITVLHEDEVAGRFSDLLDEPE